MFWADGNMLARAGKAVYTNGVPNGYVDGDMAAEVELELDALNFQVLEEEAKKAGSYKDIEPFDIPFYANVGGREMFVEAFGCLPKISDLLNIDPKGGEKVKIKISCDVTSSDFVHINGIPYLSLKDTENLVVE